MQGEVRDEALCALGKLAGPALRWLAIFGRKFYEPSFLHLPIHRKAVKPLTNISVPHK